MKLLNIFKRGEELPPALKLLKRENRTDLDLLLYELDQLLGYSCEECIREVALKRLLECYDVREIVFTLQHFNQLRGIDNVELREDVQRQLFKRFRGD